jgi:DNA invertase Pin-like site-specific DNA recombinase
MPESPLVYCAIYTRVSVEDRRGDPAVSSCAVQRDACRRFIYQHRHLGWIPLEIPFNDEGVSGVSPHRPGLCRLLDEVEAGRVQRVVVHRLDRLTRTVRDFALLQRAFDAHDVELSIVEGSFAGPSSALRRLQLNVLATFAQFEREVMAERVRDGRAAKRARGLRVAGPAPFGYSVDRRTKRLIVHRTEADAVRALFMKAQEGRTPAELAADANSSCTKDSHGEIGRWSAKVVLRLLRNPVYAGLLRDGSRGIHTPLVAQGMFERVNAAIGTRRTREPTERPALGVDPFLLRGLLVCPRCGKRLTTSSTGKVARSSPRYYRCRGLRPCPGSQLSADAIESFVVSTLAKPPAGLSTNAQVACRGVARVWELFTPDNRKRALAHLFREIRADLANCEFEFVVDEARAAELAQDLAST